MISYKQALIKTIPDGIDYDIGILKIKPKIDDILQKHISILIWGKFDEFKKINLYLYSLKAIMKIHKICKNNYNKILTFDYFERERLRGIEKIINFIETKFESINFHQR